MKLNMYDNPYKGKLITFCGLDGCGKTTQIRLLQGWLEENGFPVFVTKQPTDMVRGSEIFRNYMDQETHDSFDYRALSFLCAADRIQHCNKVISKKLEEGYIVISDRYFYSCLANLRARGYEMDTWIYEASKFIIKPDLAFFLHVPTEIAIQRVRMRPEERERYIDIPLQCKLHDQYVQIANESESESFVVSTLESQKKVHKKVVLEVNKVVLEKSHDTNG